MSRSKDSSRDQWSSESNRRYGQMQDMLAEGRSFSGNERNCCFLNTGNASSAGRRFANVSALSGIDVPDDGRALALTDWDGDGDVDLWISNRTGPQLRFFRNNADKRGHYLALRLVGNGTTANRDAIGARIEVRSKDAARKPQIATTRAGEGFLAQSSSWNHIGLGSLNVIEEVVVRWPDGMSESFNDLEVDRRYTITQGAEPVIEQDVTRSLVLTPSSPERQPATGRARIFLREPIPVPKVSFKTFAGEDVLLPLGDGVPTLVLFWVSWCPTCLEELRELISRRTELQKRGLRIIALSVNSLGEDTTPLAKAVAFSKSLGGGKAIGFGQATDGFVSDFQYLTDLAISIPRDIPLPSSFLIDGDGRLSAIYKGRLDLDLMLMDSGRMKLIGAERFEAAALAPGRAMRLPEVRRKSALSSARILQRLAATALRSRRPREAAAYYREVLRINPDHAESYVQLARFERAGGNREAALAHLRSALLAYPEYADAHRRMGELLGELGRTAEAIAHYQSAIDCNPGEVSAMNNLGWILATAKEEGLRDGERAVKIARSAIEALGSERPDLLDTLAAAYAESGEFAEAIAIGQRALALARAANQEALAEGIAKNLQRYRAGRPVRSP